METRVAQAEQTLEAKRAALEDPAVMKDGQLLEQTYREMQETQRAVDQLYERWAELEAKIKGGGRDYLHPKQFRLEVFDPVLHVVRRHCGVNQHQASQHFSKAARLRVAVRAARVGYPLRM